ncbi:hypothetical protein [Rubrivivax gelatinosus]|uniref:Uncharacterized protein n=1 Tax=Rubrivivax gelatinosus TaxID=28068 RepID=A0A4R2MQ55_RUBGE|nr:hypothetical protein [Rubrivivax gelatinosus]MBK1686805.1 hypothetical protein [Rubrivivax gelatinosus]TCP01493.1 hypothetical protein EV684_109132 [Rubrivivax gelatinosus]
MFNRTAVALSLVAGLVVAAVVFMTGPTAVEPPPPARLTAGPRTELEPAPPPVSRALLPRAESPPQRRAQRLHTASPEALFALYRAGLEADSVETKFIAREAVGYCLLSVHDLLPELPQADAQIKGEVELARTQLRDRCKLFYGESPQALQAALRALNQAVFGPDSRISTVAQGLSRDADAAEAEQLRAALSRTLQRDGGDALLWAHGGLSSWLEYLQQHPEQAAGLDETLREGATLGEAAILAGCTLGGHCGRGTLLQFMICMQTGRCGAVDAAIVADAADAAAAERMQAQAAVIAEAIRSGQLSRLGLRPGPRVPGVGPAAGLR